jgi:hypothetical protein
MSQRVWTVLTWVFGVLCLLSFVYLIYLICLVVP